MLAIEFLVPLLSKLRIFWLFEFIYFEEIPSRPFSSEFWNLCYKQSSPLYSNPQHQLVVSQSTCVIQPLCVFLPLTIYLGKT